MEPTLKLLRVNKGFNQDELGEKIGVSQTTISAWEQGKAKPSAKNIYKLAKIYAVEPTVIFNTIFKQKT
ncbi:helix-turn-helix domain-containing protein (plasmid) [Ligilactobacillus salivarius]|jgi:transcriptional regulator with XRE-family HTH domain|uniref:Helix-turn-helix domain-containing protein n=1 Tax=Ligilactobacillus salivarius TaxID=1624 RepID=A0A2A2X950_9LACO|nr:helix-turn-helix transcriptional regulator [Ligilactobacillus salivarius]MCR4913949.1 helix-turn-helix transcriptional regulator [Lactobacillus sp.]HIS16989.1 helix-turn-helix transcriptional regulator [Candidatus Coprovivens excrementavium]MBC6925058.1 XRE family transcriptional regulator [Ligilactobacillus salivarius]MBE5066055.1 helix-turn-helix transcriptional regulator [Ligilactobacillus salivarius]MBM6956711.1 helix-turn-helix transcriptional regulator [Ligilactobacillus salivarius]